MKNLEKIAQFENLYEAHKKCRLSKQNKTEVIKFEMNLAYELSKIRKELLDYSYRLGPYYEFKVFDPKERNIQALRYRDRVMQHSLCDNVLKPHLEKRLIYDNSACREGKGTHFSINRLTLFFRKHYNKHNTNGYILKFDIKKYFDSINHEILFEQMRKVFCNDREVLGLLKMIIDSYEKSEGRGLPMGNQSSQWFAIYYLNGLDHYIKEKLHIKFYTRYMDDGIIIHEDKEYLKECLGKMRRYIKENLKLEFNVKTQIVPLKQGVDYLGFHFYLTDTGKVIKKLRTSSKKRLKRKLKGFKRAYREGKIEFEAIDRSIKSYSGHLKHGNTYMLRKNIFNNFVLTRPKKREDITKQ